MTRTHLGLRPDPTNFVNSLLATALIMTDCLVTYFILYYVMLSNFMIVMQIKLF